MGAKQSRNNTDSLNWDNINTDSMSSALPNLANIDNDAKKLVSSLNTNLNLNLEDTDSENENLFSWVKNTIGNETKVDTKNEDNFSDTSPFISSDMYKYLAEKNSSITSEVLEQQGGAKKSSTTSSTSSSPSTPKRTKSSSHKNYDSSSLQGRLHNKKEILSWDLVKKIYMKINGEEQ